MSALLFTGMCPSWDDNSVTTLKTFLGSQRSFCLCSSVDQELMIRLYLAAGEARKGKCKLYCGQPCAQPKIWKIQRADTGRQPRSVLPSLTLLASTFFHQTNLLIFQGEDNVLRLSYSLYSHEKELRSELDIQVISNLPPEMYYHLGIHFICPQIVLCSLCRVQCDGTH